VHLFKHCLCRTRFLLVLFLYFTLVFVFSHLLFLYVSFLINILNFFSKYYTCTNIILICIATYLLFSTPVPNFALSSWLSLSIFSVSVSVIFTTFCPPCQCQTLSHIFISEKHLLEVFSQPFSCWFTTGYSIPTYSHKSNFLVQTKFVI